MKITSNWLVRASIVAMAMATTGTIAAPAFASEGQPGDESRDSRAAGTNAEIIVTAQRRSEVLEDVPMAVQVVTPQALENSGVKNFMDLGNIAVGARMGYNGTVPTVTVRGITSSISAYNAEPNVAVYVDGMYDPQPITLAADLSNLKNIQILKGPQGTLYGRNATGGAILIETLGPSDAYTGKFDVSYERFERVTADGFVAGPLSDHVRFSLAGHYRQGDLSLRRADPNAIGKTIGPADTFKHANIRAKLEADLTDDLTALITFSHSEIDDPRSNFYTTYGHRPSTYPAPPLSARVTDFGIVSNNTRSPFFGRLNQGIVKLEWRTGIGTLTSYTGYADRDLGYDLDFDGTYLSLTDITDRYDQKTWQQSLDYTIDAIENLTLNIGGLYYHDALTQKGNKSNNTIAGGNLVSITRRNSYSEAWALYIDGTYKITDRLSIDLGGRYSHDRKRFNMQTQNAAGAFTLPFIEDARSWGEFTPRATIRYELAPRTNVYASVTRGFRAGVYGTQGPVSIGGQPARLLAAEPEKVTAYEIGFKTAGSKLRFSAAAFYYDYTNLQVTVTAATANNSVISILQNAKSAKVKGAEAEITYNPIPNLTLRGGISVLDAYYSDFKNWVGTGVNATNTLNVSNQTQDLSGHQLVRAPDYSGSVGFDYQLPTSVGTFLLTSTLSFTDSYVVSNPSLYGPLAPPDLQNQQRLRQKAYQTLSAQLKWTDRSDHLSVTLFGDNITNTSYRISYNAGPFGDYSAKADPATYGVRFGYKY